jgi:hypothetical protein
MQEVYNNLKKLLGAHKELFTMHAYGANWGLGCNGLHISDMIEFLFDDKVKYYNREQLDKSLLDSKRSGFKEFSGTITGTTEKGHTFNICSELTETDITTPISITFNSPTLRLMIIEGTPPSVTVCKIEEKCTTNYAQMAAIRYQSELSTELVEKALHQVEIELPNYEQAMHNHLLFIETLNNQIELLLNKNTEECPIT